MTEPMGERGRQGAAPLGGHTPGPWEASRRYSHAARWLIHPAGRPHWSVASITHGGPTQHDRHDADARLIATAPEMLEALERSVRELEARRCIGFCPSCGDAVYEGWPDCPTCGDSLDSTVPLRSAIAKARGEQ